MSDVIANLIAAVRALGPEAPEVALHFGDRPVEGSVEVRIRARNDEEAAMLASRFGCTETRVAGLDGGSGYTWTQHRTPGFWATPVSVEVSGPHRRVDDSEEKAA